MYTCCIDKSSLDKCTMGSCCQNCYGLHAKFQQNPIRISSSRDKATWTNVTWTNVTWTNVNWTNVNRTNSQLLPWYWSNPYMIFTIWNAKCCKELINSFQDYDYLDKCHLDKCPVTNVIRTNVTWEMVYIHEEFTMIGSRGFCDASMVFIASLDEARLLGSLKGWPINGRE